MSTKAEQNIKIGSEVFFVWNYVCSGSKTKIKAAKTKSHIKLDIAN